MLVWAHLRLFLSTEVRKKRGGGVNKNSSLNVDFIISYRSSLHLLLRAKYVNVNRK